MTIGRLAPTPSGRLHLGNVTAFAAAWLSVRAAGGRLLLRVEDIDTTRARKAIEAAILDDLRWLGLDWDDTTPPQSTRDYGEALARLQDHTYRCICTRKVIRARGPVYTGVCRTAGHTEGAVRFALPEETIHFVDRAWGPRTVDPTTVGDPILVRRDGMVAYPLAVVVDDGRDGVTEVVRGADLLDQSAIQACLHRALGQPPPSWLHSPLVIGPDGRKLSKSHGSVAIASWRAAGASPRDVWRTVLPWLGIAGDNLHEAVHAFTDAIAHPPITTSAGPPPR